MEKDTKLELYTNKNLTPNYQDNVEPYLEDIEQALKEGWTIKSIAQKLGVSNDTFKNYMNKHPELRYVVLKGADKTIKKLEKALLKSALGYKTKKVKKAYDAMGNLLGTQEEEYDVAPNVNAIMFSLCNLKGEKYSRQDKVIEDDEKNTIIIKMPEKLDKWSN